MNRARGSVKLVCMLMIMAVILFAMGGCSLSEGRTEALADTVSTVTLRYVDGTYYKTFKDVSRVLYGDGYIRFIHCGQDYTFINYLIEWVR